MNISFVIHKVAIAAPGLTTWSEAKAILRGEAPYEPNQPHTDRTALPPSLPPIEGLASAEKRRMSNMVKLAVAVAQQAQMPSLTPTERLISVFTSSSGDGATCHSIFSELAQGDRLVSPTQFHNSVHNASAGYWSIASQSTAASTSICAYDASFGAGLIEALVQSAAATRPVLLVSSDMAYPAPLNSVRFIEDYFGVALLLEHFSAYQTRVHHLDPVEKIETIPALTGLCHLSYSSTAPSHVKPAALEALRRGNPSARSLPLLQAVAGCEHENTSFDETVYLDYLAPHSLALRVQSWVSMPTAASKK